MAERLGEGSFAVVKRALWKRADGVKLDVAVKILRDPTKEIMEDLQQEVNNMQRLQHPNLIRLYGIVFSNPSMMVIFLYFSNVELRSFYFVFLFGRIMPKWIFVR